MSVQEDVLIVLKAKDEVSSVVEDIRRTIESLGGAFNNSIPNGSDFVKGFGDGVESVGESVEKTSYRMSGFGKLTKDVGSQANINFTQMAERMDKFHVGLNRVTNAMTGLFGTMGLWGMAHESWMFATQRQTNQIYLGMRRGTEEAKSMYNEIQNIVMELPGDDTFLTTILTQASGRDMTMSIDNIRTLGDSIADYYVAATAKGQLSYETQRELTSYILTGETRMFTNSVLADEIELLKNKNTVSERAVALQEALNKTGFEGMAHYESATNAMEEFKGHFQKAFADLGTLALPFIQAILGIYNALDSLVLNGGISAGLITLATSIAGFTTALGTIGFVTPMVNEGVKSLYLFGQGIGNIRSGFSDLGVIGYFRNHIRGLVKDAEGLIAIPEELAKIKSATPLTTSIPMTGQTFTGLQYELENGAIITNTQLKLQNLMATTRLNEQELALMITQEGKTYEEYLNTVGLDANTTALLENMAVKMEMSEAELLNLAVKSDLTTAEFLETLQTNLETIATENDTVATALNTEVEAENEAVRNVGILSRIKSIATKIWDAITTGNLTIAVLSLGGAEVNEEIIRNSSFLTKVKDIAIKITSTAQNLWEAFSLYTVVDGEVVLNTEKALGIITRLQEFIATLNNVVGFNLASIGLVGEAGAEAISNKERLVSIATRIWHTITMGAETVAMYGLIGAAFLLDLALSPIGLTIIAIVSAVILLVKGLEWLGQAFGWWSDIGGMFEAIGDGLHRIWDAFMNSEPVQAIITSFQNFAYTMESFFGSLWGILGGIFEVFFGVNNQANGTVDIVQGIITVMNTLLDIIYNFTPLGWLIQGILALLDSIGGSFAWIMDQWNSFIDSAEMQGLITDFQEVRIAFGEAWEAIGGAINEVLSVFEEVDDSVESNKEESNWLRDSLRVLASFISMTVVPILKGFATALKLLVSPITWVRDTIVWLNDGLDSLNTMLFGTSDSVEEVEDKVEETVSPLSILFDWFSNLVNVISNLFNLIFTGVTSIDWLGMAFDGLSNILSPIISLISTILSLFGQLGDIGNIVYGVVNFIGQAFNGLISFLQPVSEFINTIVDKFMWLEEKFGWVANGIGEFLGGDTDKQSASGQLGSEASLLDSFGLDINDVHNGISQFNDDMNKSNQAYLNRDIRGVYSNDSASNYLRNVDATGQLGHTYNYDRSQSLMAQYHYNQQEKTQTIINNFNEGSVQADARNMSSKDVQKMFTSAFGYNKARGTKGILN